MYICIDSSSTIPISTVKECVEVFEDIGHMYVVGPTFELYQK